MTASPSVPSSESEASDKGGAGELIKMNNVSCTTSEEIYHLSVSLGTISTSESTVGNGVKATEGEGLRIKTT